MGALAHACPCTTNVVYRQAPALMAGVGVGGQGPCEFGGMAVNARAAAESPWDRRNVCLASR